MLWLGRALEGSARGKTRKELYGVDLVAGGWNSDPVIGRLTDLAWFGTLLKDVSSTSRFTNECLTKRRDVCHINNTVVGGPSLLLTQRHPDETF